MLFEEKILNELKQCDTDEKFKRQVCGFPVEGELSEQDRKVYDYLVNEERAKIEEKLKRVQNWIRHPEDSAVPRRFAHVSFFNFECRNEAEKKHLQDVIEFTEHENNDGILLMTGDKGTGKTHLGISAVRDNKGYYINMEDLIYKVESSLNFKSPMTEDEVFSFYSGKPFLVIDEIGRSIKQEKENEILSYILRKRYDLMLPTVIISNLSRDDLLRKLGEAVVDRLIEVATSVEFSGESYRILKRKVPDVA